MSQKLTTPVQHKHNEHSTFACHKHEERSTPVRHNAHPTPAQHTHTTPALLTVQPSSTCTDRSVTDLKVDVVLDLLDEVLHLTAQHLALVQDAAQL